MPDEPPRPAVLYGAALGLLLAPAAVWGLVSLARRRRKDGTLYKRNPWHDHLMDIYSCAAHAWWLLMEDTTSEYASEVREFREHTPPPQLKHFMVELSLTWGGRA